MSLQEWDTTIKEQINKFSVLEFETGDNKEYKREDIQNNIVYAKKADGYLLGLYYLIIWKDYPKRKNT